MMKTKKMPLVFVGIGCGLLTQCGDGKSSPSDVTPPAITLNGAATVIVEAGDEFIDPGATATDDVDGDISSRIVVTGSVDTSTLGVFVLSYDVADAAGNEAPTVRRAVNVIDTTPPTLVLAGGAVITAEAGRAFVDPGFSAADNLDGDISARVVVTGEVDTSRLGTYTLTYGVSDSAGNTARPETRTVAVRDGAAPDVTIAFPARGALTEAEEITIRGRASDFSGVARVEINGALATTADDFATWSVDMPLGQGVNRLSLLATDSLGNGVHVLDWMMVERNVRILQFGGWVYDDSSNYAYALDQTRPAIIRIDLATGARTYFSSATVGDGEPWLFPTSIVLDRANGRVLITDNNAVVAVDLATGDRSALTSATVGRGPPMSPDGLAVDLGRGRLLVADSSRNAVFAVDLSTGDRTVLTSSTVGQGPELRGPSELVIDANNNRLVVSSFGTDALMSVDLVSGERAVFVSDLPGTAFNMAIDATTNRLLCRTFTSEAVFAVNLDTGASTIVVSEDRGTGPPLGNRFALLPSGRLLMWAFNTIIDADVVSGDRAVLFELQSIGDGITPIVPGELAVDSDGHRLIAADLAGAAAIDFTTSDGSRLYRHMPFDGNPFEGLAFDPVGRLLWLGRAFSNEVVEVDLVADSFRVVSSDEVGFGPNYESARFIVVDERDGRLYVSDGETASVLSIDTASGARAVVADADNGSGPPIDLPGPLTLHEDRLLVVDAAGAQDRIFTLDPRTGVRSVLAGPDTGEGVVLPNIEGTAVDALEGRLLALSSDGLVAVHLESGDRTAVGGSSDGQGPWPTFPRGIVVDEPNRRALISVGAILAVDLITGDRAFITQ